MTYQTFWSASYVRGSTSYHRLRAEVVIAASVLGPEFPLSALKAVTEDARRLANGSDRAVPRRAPAGTSLVARACLSFSARAHPGSHLWQPPPQPAGPAPRPGGLGT